MIKPKIYTLQYGRALASFAVLFQHALVSTGGFVERPPSIIEYIGERGFYGVDFFFVLSGFIIFQTHFQDEKNLNSAKKYIEKRLRRIYLPYLPISFFLIIMYTIYPKISESNRNWGLFSSITLFPTSYATALSVAWTLSFEMMFYIIFLINYTSRFFIHLLFLWIISIFVTFYYKISFEYAIINNIFSLLNLEFLIGAILAFLYNKLPKSWWIWLSISGFFGLIIYFLAFDAESYRLLFGFFLAPILLGLALYEKFHQPKPLNWLIFLGDSSFAIYLVHRPLVSLSSRLTAFTHNWLISLTFTLIVSLLCGIAYHIFIERPLSNFVPKYFSTTRESSNE